VLNAVFNDVLLIADQRAVGTVSGVERIQGSETRLVP